MTARVVVVEDDAATRAALCRAVAEAPGLELVNSADSFDAARSILDQSDCDILLIDLGLGAHSGVELIRRMRARSTAKIVVLTVLGDEFSVINAIEAGADSYILKDGAFSNVTELVEQVLAGDAPISPAAARHLLRRFQLREAQGAPEDDLLSRRESQLLVELARGASYKEVARKLDLSVHTIGDYVKSLYRKLGVNSRGEAVSKAFAHGLIENAVRRAD